MAENELQRAESALNERRNLYWGSNSTLTLEEKRIEVLKMYGEAAKNGYDKDMAVLGYVGHIAVADLVSQYLPDTSSRLLDGGCGTGLLGQELKRRGFLAMDALDPSKEFLDCSREKGVYTNFFCEALGPNRLPIQDDTYDGVCLSGVIGRCHVHLDSFPELIRITKPGGYIMFSLRDKQFVDDEICGNGKLDAVLHKMAVMGFWDYMEKKRKPYVTCKMDVHDIEYCYAGVLRVR